MSTSATFVSTAAPPVRVALVYDDQTPDIDSDEENYNPATRAGKIHYPSASSAAPPSIAQIAKKNLPPRPPSPSPTHANHKQAKHLIYARGGDSASTSSSSSRDSHQAYRGKVEAPMAAAASAGLASFSDSLYFSDVVQFSSSTTAAAFLAAAPTVSTAHPSDRTRSSAASSNGALSGTGTALQQSASAGFSPSPAPARGAPLNAAVLPNVKTTSATPLPLGAASASAAARPKVLPKNILAESVLQKIRCILNGDLTSENVLAMLKLIISPLRVYQMTNKDKEAPLIFLQELQIQKPATLQAATLIFKSIFKNCANPAELCLAWLAFSEEFNTQKSGMRELLATENPARPFNLLPAPIRKNPICLDETLIQKVAQQLLQDGNFVGEKALDSIDNQSFLELKNLRDLDLFAETRRPAEAEREDFDALDSITEEEARIVAEITESLVEREIEQIVLDLNAIEARRTLRESQAKKSAALAEAITDSLLRDLLHQAAPPKKPVPPVATAAAVSPAPPK